MGLNDRGIILAPNLDSNLPAEKCLDILNDADNYLKIYEEYLQHAKKLRSDTPSYCEYERMPSKDSQNSFCIRLIKGLTKMSDRRFKNISKDFSQAKYVYDGNIAHQNKNLFERIECSYDDEDETLYLSRLPENEKKIISAEPQTYTLEKQIIAINSLLNNPRPEYQPIIKLLIDQAKNGYFLEDCQSLIDRLVINDSDFVVLNQTEFIENQNEGTLSQKEFVKIALSTPDFAFLEGPPGSGKTETICEIILQSVKKDEKVLLIAPSHAAVDNVLEKVKEYNNEVISVRISANEKKVDEELTDRHINHLKKTEQELIIDYLKGCASDSLSDAQQIFLDAVESDDEIATDIILKSADLVCGTNIGILQHPYIKKMGDLIEPIYDLMIIDEASRSPFQEWLVPALFAKKWIIVGDTLQLPPFVDQNDYASNIETKLADNCKSNSGFPHSDSVMEVCMDLFNIYKTGKSVIVISPNRNNFNIYMKQAKNLNPPIEVIDLDSLELSYEISNDGAKLFLCNNESFEKFAEDLPLDIADIRGDIENTTYAKRLEEYRKEKQTDNINIGNRWGIAIAWRLDMAFQLRNYEDVDKICFDIRKDYLDDFEHLLPKWNPEFYSKLKSDIESIGIVPLPSILESLQNGYIGSNLEINNSLISGLDKQIFDERHVLLEHQHRMDENISKFSRDNIYKKSGKECLKDPQSLIKKRKEEFKCPNYNNNRSVWVTGNFTQSETEKGNYQNEKEADELVKHLASLVNWAKKSESPSKNKKWEFAVLTFYNGQFELLRKKIKEKYPGLEGNKKFRVSENINLRLSTVDGFQGHEAHIVLISMVNSDFVGFLKVPNRLNVALTRAKNLNVIFGVKNYFEKKQHSSILLKELAAEEKYFMVINDVKREEIKK